MVMVMQARGWDPFSLSRASHLNHALQHGRNSSLHTLFVCDAGWFNLLGQVAVTAAIEYSLANHLACMIVLGTGGADNGGHIVTQGQLLGIYAGQFASVLSATVPH